MAIKGLWPDDLVESPEETPEDILQVQAADLSQKTGNLIQGQVEKGSAGGWVTLDFLLVVPELNDYTYRLFKVRHKLQPYPLEIITDSLTTVQAGSRGEFVTALERIF